MTDGWMKLRGNGQHEEVPGEPRSTAPRHATQLPPPGQPAAPTEDVHQALQMLTLAQRTADEHVATAHRQAEKVQADARAAAEQILQEARAQAESVRTEADTVLAEARALTEQSARDAKAQADAARQNGEKIVADARAQAARIAEEAKAGADELKRQAQQRYDDEVGNLAAKRESLQQQIEALQEFDRDYRSRLLTFMQAQLRAMWVDEPRVEGEIGEVATPAAKGVSPAKPARVSSGAWTSGAQGSSPQGSGAQGPAVQGAAVRPPAPPAPRAAADGAKTAEPAADRA